MILRRIYRILLKYFGTPLAYAKFIGVNIGSDNLIKKTHWSSEPYLITIGSHCQLTDCKIHTHGGGVVVRHLYPSFDVFGKVKIGDYCYIGTGSQIMPGVTIGNHVLIAAGSIVTKSVPSNVVIAGNPAKIICSIKDFLEKNKNFDLGTKGLNNIRKKELLKALTDNMFIRKELLTV